jgi:prepilin-type processing-associated H-X9-DG protein
MSTRTPEQASRNAAALGTLRANWDSDIITGATVDEIKKVLDAGSTEDIEPLLERLELLEQFGEAYAPDFALWWEKRGRVALGGKLFWKRDLLHEALELAMAGRNDAEVMGMLREAAATGDPVARMWQALSDQGRSGRHDGSVLGSILLIIDEVRGLIQSGDTDAAYFLALFAIEGDMDLVGGSPDEVIGWLEMAADAGIGNAANLLAESYSRGRRGFPRDPVKAAEWAAKASGTQPANRAPASHGEELKAHSQNNLKQLGLVMKMFANEAQGELFPPLTTLRGHLAMDAVFIYPEFLSDTTVYISPAHPDYLNIATIAESDAPSVMGDHSYWYLGYMLPDEATGLAFVNHFRTAARSGEVLTETIEAPELESERIFRLRNGIERFLITDIHDARAATGLQSTIPLIIERPGFHEGGANVLFLDGHVEFMPYPGTFPMTKPFIQALQSLEDVRQTL